MSCARSSRTKIKVFKDKRNTLLDEENDISQTSEEIPTQHTVRILSLNIFVRPPLIKNNENDHKWSRLKFFLENGINNYDIIAFQELFGSFSSKRDKFLKKCQRSGFKYYVACPSSKCGYFVDGGLVIMSRLPIVESDFYPYKRGTHSDALAEKGVLYAKILVGERGVPFHFFNTHLQASYQDASGSKSYEVRQKQIQRLTYYILSKTIEDEYPIVLVGDFNVDARSEMPEKKNSEEYETLMKLLTTEYFKPIDILFEEASDNGEHPITFGDSIIDEQSGRAIPRETILTHPSDFCTNQRLDYIFLFQRKKLGSINDASFYKNEDIQNLIDMEYESSESDKIKVKKKDKKKSKKKKIISDEESKIKIFSLNSKNTLLEVVPRTTKVQHFFTNPHHRLKFTQISDHYGVESVLNFHDNKDI